VEIIGRVDVGIVVRTMAVGGGGVSSAGMGAEKPLLARVVAVGWGHLCCWNLKGTGSASLHSLVECGIWFERVVA